MYTESTLSDHLRQAGLRLTPQRLAICQLLVNNTEHPSAQSIFEQLRQDYPSLSLTTVYNTLEALVRLGAIHNLGNDVSGTIRYDAETTPHANLICTSCNRVVDFHSSFVQALADEVNEQSGYRIAGARVLYYGLCAQCQHDQEIA
jgi:Fur family transcriptional regulator, peroxide stress response regulator